jgi:NADH-quinone oxidoreductase subunit N
MLLAAILFSLAGIPPLAGFFAKYYVFVAAIEAELYPLAIIGVVTSVVGAFYYLRIVKVMYFDDPAEKFERMPVELRTVLVISGVFVIAFMVFMVPILDAADKAATTLF